jgi:hypothetical protein
MFFILPSGPSASFANCQLTSVDSCNWRLPPTNSQHAVLVFRLPPLLLPLPPLPPPYCLRRRRYYTQRRCHPRRPQPLFAAPTTICSLCQPPMSLLPPPLVSMRYRHCRPKPLSAATVSHRCQSLLPPPPPTFSTVPNRCFPQSPLCQCVVCRFWYITKNRGKSHF